MKTIFVNSQKKNRVGLDYYVYNLLNSLDRNGIRTSTVTPIPDNVHNYVVLQTEFVRIFIFMEGTDMTGTRDVDEAFNFDEETTKYLYGAGYERRYTNSPLNYILEADFWLGRRRLRHE